MMHQISGGREIFEHGKISLLVVPSLVGGCEVSGGIGAVLVCTSKTLVTLVGHDFNFRMYTQSFGGKFHMQHDIHVCNSLTKDSLGVPS